MAKPKISVIIPVYNVEKYLNECLDSVCNQTLKDIEIICINDGSTDGSLEILESYAKKDKRIKIVNKKNSGYGDSMNQGLDMAIGDYVGIVESDDFVELNMFENLYQEATKNNLDITRSNYYEYNTKNNENKIIDRSYIKHNEIYAPIDNIVAFFQPPAIWANLYNRDFLNKNNIRFLPTPGASYQDTAFAFKTYACAKRFKMIKNAYVHYRIDNSNSSVNTTNKIYCVCDEYAEIQRFIISIGKYRQFRTLIPRTKYGCYRWNYNNLDKSLKFQFLKRMSKEYFMHFLKGEISRKLYTKEELRRLFTISFFPLIYINKKEL